MPQIGAESTSDAPEMFSVGEVDEEDWEEDDDDRNVLLREHGDHPPFRFHGLGNLFFGIELETDGYWTGGRAQVCIALKDIDPNEKYFWLQDDSSLDNGIEITTHPMTLDYLRQSFAWDDILNIVRENGGNSEDTDTCGLHIHFSRVVFDRGYAQDFNTMKLLYLVEKFWDNLVTFSRRTPYALRSWARRYDSPIRGRDLDKKFQHAKKFESVHYRCVNISNEKTIEIRIFRGTLNQKTIIASVELVHLLVQVVLRCSLLTLQHMSWRTFVKRVNPKKYPSLHQYLLQKGLKKGGQDVPDYCETQEKLFAE